MIPPLMIEQFVSVYDAVTTLFMYDVGSLYVKKCRRGTNWCSIPQRPSALRYQQFSSRKTPVAMIMTRMPNIVTITADQTILTAGTFIS